MTKGRIEVISLEVSDAGDVNLSAPLPKGTFTSIGSFDGVHLGHVRVMEQAFERSASGPHAVILFGPHPQAYFRPDAPPFRLSLLPQQMALFEALGLDYAVVIRFDANLARMSPRDFVQKVLVEALKVRFVAAGFDFNFGARGAGKAADLVTMGAEFAFEVAILDCQTGPDGQKLSSTAVRDALKAGDCQAATAILGRPHAILGEVVHGAKQGRTIGFPTLNVELGVYQRPRYGIYVTRTRLSDGRLIDGVSNIGIRPTVGGEVELLETFLFDFSEEVYGQTVETELLDYVRPEAKFDSWEELKAGIAKDVATARAWLAANPRV